MIEPLTPPPIEKPDIVVPDAGPLIHLAQANLLHLLHEAGGAVVVVDMVAHEVTRDLSEPGATELHEWMQRGREPGSNQPVRVEETDTGRLYTAALEARPDFKLRNGGETAIVEWLAEKIAGTDRPVIVLYENGRVPIIVRNQSMDADIDVMTTRAFLEGMQRRDMARKGEAIPASGTRLPATAETYWNRVAAVEPTANSRVQSFSQRRVRS
jgi:hypothetical protein